VHGGKARYSVVTVTRQVNVIVFCSAKWFGWGEKEGMVGTRHGRQKREKWIR
jgi:hypothetical protein